MKKSNKKNPEGKLYSRWINSGPKTKIQTVDKESNENVDDVISKDDDIDERSLETMRIWLQNNLEPWKEVKEKWKKTSRCRRNFFMQKIKI